LYFKIKTALADCVWRRLICLKIPLQHIPITYEGWDIGKYYLSRYCRIIKLPSQQTNKNTISAERDFMCRLIHLKIPPQQISTICPDKIL
jgi:hypothetical protein